MAGINIHKKVVFHLKKGALHSELHMKPGAKIPLAKLEKEKASAKRTGNTTLEKRTTFAINARSFKH
jgi:hypothetical protein